jgi:hypothetical protein
MARRRRRRLRQLAVSLSVGVVLLSGVFASAQTLGPTPGANDIDWFGAAPPTPEECYRLGIRYWIKKRFLDKKTACQCVKCGWTHRFPPRRLCWRVC